jgi:hypothetical protein
VTILAAGKIVPVTSRRAVVGGQCVNAAFEMVTHFGVCENNLTRRFFDVAATQAIHRFGAIVWDLVYVGMAALAANPCVGALAEKLFVHVKKAIVALLVHAGKTPKPVAHQAVL